MTKTPEQIRLEAVLEPGELAERAGVSVPTISRIEHGQVRRLRASVLERIGAALQKRFQERGESVFKLSQYIEAAMAVRKRRAS